MKKRERLVKGTGSRYAHRHGVRRVALTVMAFSLAMGFILIACAVPENQGGQSNAGQQAGAADWQAVEQALGKKGSMRPGDVYKVSLPRNDLQVTAGGVQLKPARARLLGRL